MGPEVQVFNPTEDTDTDKLVAVSVNDTTPSYLDSKISVGSNLAKTIVNPGGNEVLNIFLANLTGFDTDDLTEGTTNLYFTNERVDDRVAALIIAGTGISVVYDDVAGTLTISSTITQYTDEMAQDAVGAMIADTNTVDLAYVDGTPALTANVRYQDGNGIDLSDDASGLKADIYFASQTRGDLIVRGATLWGRLALGTAGYFLKAGATDPAWAQMVASDISDFAEAVDDRVGALFIDGNGINFVYDDAGNTLTADIYFASQARGDIIVRGATLWQRLALGSSGQALVSNGTDIVWGAPSVGGHDVLSATHTDTLAAAVVRGDIIVGNATPKWSRLAKGTSGYFLKAGASDVSWAQLLASDVSDFDEAVDDRVAALLSAGSGITLVYSDVGNSLVIGSVWTKTGTVLSPTTAGDTLQIGDGVAGAPGYAFSGDADTGFYLPTSARVALSIAGTGRYDFGASQLILGSYNSVSANTIDFAFNGSTPRLRMGLGWYIQLNQTAPLGGVEMIGDLFPLTDLDAGAVLGDATRRFLLSNTAQNLSATTEAELSLRPFYATRILTNPASGPTYDFYSKWDITINGSGVSRTFTNGWLYREINPAISASKNLTLAGAEFRMVEVAVLSTGGTFTETDHYWESFERTVPEWDIHITGAHRNRYNGLAPTALGVGVPDSFVVVFPYALPDALYSVQTTGGWAQFTITDIKKLVIGTGWVYVKAVVDASTKTVNGFTGYQEYQAIDNATKASWAGSSWNNYTIMIGLAGILAHYPGGVAILFSDADLFDVEWAIRRYY